MLIIKLYYHICAYIWRIIWKCIYGRNLEIGGGYYLEKEFFSYDWEER